ncbi:MAG: hypothetical protein QGG71_24415, partial [Pirellulaceae bacterium]|nr:hypothetical protein [Pirellulaceae bacterium]
MASTATLPASIFSDRRSRYFPWRIRRNPFLAIVKMKKQRIGAWLLGAQGGVATTTIVGLIAL